MSAYLCEDVTFYTVATFLRPDASHVETLALTRFLKGLNELSLRARYPKDYAEIGVSDALDRGDLPTVEITGAQIAAIACLPIGRVAGVCNGYMYQACEFKGFYDVEIIAELNDMVKGLDMEPEGWTLDPAELATASYKAQLAELFRAATAC